MTAKSCYVCGGYLYRGVRHRTCEPRYRRIRVQPCELCGRMARGRRHRLCTVPPTGYSLCGYCGAVCHGTYHNTCYPVGLGDLAIFPDEPEVVQRRCRDCREWWPFAGRDIDVRVNWKPHGKTANGRPSFGSVCRACLAERRRDGVPIEVAA